MAQAFGIMPLHNILQKDVAALRFRWRSFNSIYAIFCCICLVVYSCFTIAWSVKGGVDFGRIVPIIFYTSNTIATIVFVRLASKWPKVMIRWRSTEALMAPIFNERYKRGLNRDIKLLFIIIMALSLGE